MGVGADLGGVSGADMAGYCLDVLLTEEAEALEKAVVLVGCPVAGACFLGVIGGVVVGVGGRGGGVGRV